MKKYIILTILLLAIVMVGCTNNKQTNSKDLENSKTVYCNNCGSESKEVTKFCSNCGVEAKWVSEKPKVSKDKEKNEISNKESKETKPEVKKDKVEETKKNNEEEYNTCWICGKRDKLSNLEHMHGVGYYIHSKCYENYPSCKTCGNNLAGIDDDRDNICDFCEDHVCSVCGKYYEDTSELYNGVCNTCQFNEEYKDVAVCNSCSKTVDKSLAGQKCTSCGEGVYEVIVK